MRWAIVVLVILAGGSTAADVQVKSVKLLTPARLFGYFCGDLLHSEVDVVVDKGVELDRASVPQPGPLSQWLELSASRIDESSRDDATFYRLSLDYQNFYPALDTRSFAIPGFTLSFTSGARTISAPVPGWSFVISPLREVMPETRSSGVAYMQPDVEPQHIDLRHYRSVFFGFLLASLAALALLAYHLAWWPFKLRAKRPFSGAARRVRTLANAHPDESGYREALLTLHRAVDASAGHVVFAEDLPDFLGKAPEFAQLGEGFGRFFQSSRLAFFGDDVAAATADFSFGDLSRLCRRLAAAERAAR